MRPTSTQNALGQPQGAAQAPSERLLGGLLAALGAFLVPSWRLLGLLALPGGSRRVPGSLREVIFGAFFGGRRRDPEISCFLIMFVNIIKTVNP